MSGEQLSAVENELGNSLQKKTNLIVKSSVIQVTVIAYAFLIFCLHSPLLPMKLSIIMIVFRTLIFMIRAVYPCEFNARLHAH